MAESGVVREVLDGALRPNVSRNSKLIALDQPGVSKGANEIVVEEHAGSATSFCTPIAVFWITIRHSCSCLTAVIPASSVLPGVEGHADRASRCQLVLHRSPVSAALANSALQLTSPSLTLGPRS